MARRASAPRRCARRWLSPPKGRQCCAAKPLLLHVGHHRCGRRRRCCHRACPNRRQLPPLGSTRRRDSETAGPWPEAEYRGTLRCGRDDGRTGARVRGRRGHDLEGASTRNQASGISGGANEYRNIGSRSRELSNLCEESRLRVIGSGQLESPPCSPIKLIWRRTTERSRVLPKYFWHLTMRQLLSKCSARVDVPSYGRAAAA